MNKSIVEKSQIWLSSTFDTNTQAVVQDLIDYNPKELEDAFFQDLAFGTGGIRGVMGVGTNRINKYTLGKSTQGLCIYLKKQYPNHTKPLKIVIAYDCRNDSDTLASVVSEVCSSNGLQVYLFSALRPTPELSFAVKHLGCQAGIVITASHNPPEYNGFKAYWNDSSQIVPPHDTGVVREIENIDFSDIQFEKNDALIQIIDKEVDDAFIKTSLKNAILSPNLNRNDYTIIFTALHGTSITLLPTLLAEAGYKNVISVAEQATPNGNFPTVASPNPEETAALKMAFEYAKRHCADIVLATDPDADRLGIAIRDFDAQIYPLNGNQTMMLLTKYLLDKKKATLSQSDFIATTIVSTPMFEKMATHYGVTYKIVLTGFKWIAKMIKDHPELSFIGGGEESYGYMVSDFVRDKDAITTALLACEMGNDLKQTGSSMYQELIDCYVLFGHYKESLISITKKGAQGIVEIETMMSQYRTNPPQQIIGEKVISIEDYLSSTLYNTIDDKTTAIDLPQSNVLIFNTEKGSRIAIRPSGTEPKIKIYLSVCNPLQHQDLFEENEKLLQLKIKQITDELNIQ